MRGSQRRRLASVAAASLALHGAVLVWLAWPRAPDFFTNGPDLSLMSVELLAPARREPPGVARSRAAPTAPGQARPAPVALPAARDPPSSVAASASAEVAAVPAPAGAVSPDRLRAALRSGGGGCARARSREEREACEERLGRLTPGTPSYDAPMDPGKRAYYDAVVAAGPSGRTYGDPKPMGAAPDGDYFRVLNCSIQFGAGKKQKGRQGEVKLGRSPCSIPLQGSFITPEASVRKR
jgi:hypothetical protein